MKIAIMQPYLFPYLGYFQLIKAVDIFVIYDDVNYIKQGWINRNYLMINCNKYLFSIPISNLSSNKIISKTEIDKSKFNKWINDFLKTLNINYRKAPFFDSGIQIVNDCLNKTNFDSISDLNTYAMILISNYLGIKTKIVEHSNCYKNIFLKGTERIIDICLKENARIYINPIGGTELYNKEDFKKRNIELKFIKTKFREYKQLNCKFIPGLSILDIIMHNSPDEIKSMLNEYELF